MASVWSPPVPSWMAAVAGTAQAGRVPVHDEQPGAATGERGRDDEDVGAGAVRHRLLDAAQRPVAAGLGGRDRGGGRRPAGADLGVREGRQRGAAGDAREELALLLVGADGVDEPAGQDDGLDERLGCQDPPDLLGDDRHLDRACAHAAVLLGEGETQQAHLGQLSPDLLVEARVGLGDLAAHLAVAVRPGQQRRDGFAQVVLLAVVVEVHGYLTTPGSCRR
jgi:hypothetical protein